MKIDEFRATQAAKRAAKMKSRAEAAIARAQARDARKAAAKEVKQTKVLELCRRFGGDVTGSQLSKLGRGFPALANGMVKRGQLIRLQAAGDGGGARYGLADAAALTA